MFDLYWLSSDEQAEIYAGTFDHMSEDAERAAWAELLAQCTDDEQREGIRAGRMVWEVTR